MTNLAWIILGISSAILLDLLILWLLHRRRGRQRTSRPEDMKPHATQVEISFELAEDQGIDINVRAYQAADEIPKLRPSQAQIRIDPSLDQLPESIILEPQPAPSPSHKVITHSTWVECAHDAYPILLLNRLRAFITRALDSRLMRALQTLVLKIPNKLPSLEVSLFVLSLMIYALTRLVQLEEFPIYFFTDEAVQTVLAADFLRDNFHDYQGHLFPTFFQNNSLYNLCLSVYIQLLPYALFGKSVFVTRAVSVLITITAVAALGLILKEIFHIRIWWSGTLLLSITPAWFLHSRTAFETILFASMYTWFLYFYLRYRRGAVKFAFPALLFAGAAFYSYSGGQMVIAATCILLIFSDIIFHLKHWRMIRYGIPLVLLLALPYIRFRIQYPEATYFHLRMLDTYWLHNISILEKLATFFQHYLRGLNPYYWYIPNEIDLQRHLMKGYGHILAVTLPFALLGLVSILRSLRSSANRALLITLLAAPLGGALIHVGITRVIIFVIPTALITALGLSIFVEWLVQRIPEKVVSISIFALLGTVNILMCRDALVNGPTWYHNYGLGGMQYGARQVYPAANALLEREPESRVFVTPTWANGAHILKRFFVSDDVDIIMGNADSFYDKKLDLDENTYFVLTQDEVEQALESERVTNVRTTQTIPCPDGTTCFYFIRMQYSPDAEKYFAQEERARFVPVDEEITLDGQTTRVIHPRFDMGELERLFDRDPFTLVRTDRINPAHITLIFKTPRKLTGLSLTTGTMDLSLVVKLFETGTQSTRTYHKIYSNLPPDPTVYLTFGRGIESVRRLEIEITGFNLNDSERLHLRDLALEE